MGSLATDPELATRVLSFTSVLRFESRDPERDRDRYYDIVWQPSFWGDGALVCVWGRRGRHEFGLALTTRRDELDSVSVGRLL